MKEYGTLADLQHELAEGVPSRTAARTSVNAACFGDTLPVFGMPKPRGARKSFPCQNLVHVFAIFWARDLFGAPHHPVEGLEGGSEDRPKA